MLQIVEESHRSDTGRQRAANEDSLFVRSPLFAVADGMGGAQAGEVASSTAAATLDGSERGSDAPEAYLRGIAQAANSRIHELAQEDASRSGMGTTLTAALLDGEELSLAHVGDSRAYRLRDGELRLLTSDHSLVEELRRQGRLTDEEAEDHPQRSIITRALGPEPDVEVDTMTYRVRPGDVYLLCSDGLTTMLKEPAIEGALRESSSLDEATKRLIDEANAAGGRDNITVVAFRVDDSEVPVGREAVPAKPDAGATLVGPAAEEAGLTGSAVRERVSATNATPPRPRRPAEPPPPRPGRRRRILTRLVLPVVVLALIVGGLVFGARQIYFVGSDSAGRIALYRGLPYDLPLGISLYSEEFAEPVQLSSLPVDRQHSVTDHTLRSHDDAASLIKDLVTSANPPSHSSSNGGTQRVKPQGKNSGSGKQTSGGNQAGSGKQTSGGNQAGSGKQTGAGAGGNGGAKPKQGSGAGSK
jgi:serine/threonine protein phosphatase PrpC